MDDLEKDTDRAGNLKSSFDFKFKGTNIIPTLTLMARVERGEANSSNNPTWLKRGSYGEQRYLSGPSGYIESSENLEIKNIVKSDCLPWNTESLNWFNSAYCS